ncbi:MAG TPA: thioesterase family protein, partial [Acidimicrobiales bacterium]|nr:thioesterase family protein [Acidimicrobiales bacterium]
MLYRTEVTQDQIDHLGHMNVRFYGAHARTGAERLLADLGLVADEGRALVGRDVYVRHHREQLVGAPLEVRGGVFDASTERVRLYEELRNSDTGDVAAAFVLGFELADRSTREPVAIGEPVVVAADAAAVPVPEHGRPRSIRIDDDPTSDAPSPELLAERGLALRRPRVVEAGDIPVDVDGFASPAAAGELMWGGEPVEGREFQGLQTLPNGHRMGFATMETRSTWARAPRVGDRVQSFAAELDLQAKTMLTRHWLFDV